MSINGNDNLRYDYALCPIAEKGPAWRKLPQQGIIKERESSLPCKATGRSQVNAFVANAC